MDMHCEWRVEDFLNKSCLGRHMAVAVLGDQRKPGEGPFREIRGTMDLKMTWRIWRSEEMTGEDLLLTYGPSGPKRTK